MWTCVGLKNIDQLWGRLPGVDGRIVEKALSARETELPVLPGQGQGQRRADALTTICLDSLTGTSGEDGEGGRAVTVAEMFIDGALWPPNRTERQERGSLPDPG